MRVGATEGDNVVRFPVERRQAKVLLTVRELQEALGFSERWWRERIKEGLPRRKWGRGLRFDLNEVQAWLDERYAGQIGEAS